MINILLVDDQAAVRRGLRMRLALEQDLQIVGEASNSGEALMLAQTLVPDVIVVDIEMPGVDTVRNIKHLREVSADSAVVVLTMSGDNDTRTKAHEAGVQAFVEKQGGAEGLLQAIRRVARHDPEPVPDASTGGGARHRTGEADRTATGSLAKRRLSVG